MKSTELGVAVGSKMMEGYDFIYNLLSKPVTFDDAFAEMIEQERKKFFAEFIPLLKQLEQLDDEAYEECLRVGMMKFAELPDLEDKEAKIYEVAEGFDDDMDPQLMMNLASFMWIVMFLEIKELVAGEVEGPDLLGFIGY